MVADLDVDGTGMIGYDDFLALMSAKMAERDPREEIIKAFRLFDDDETGKISFKNLKRVAKELGESITGRQVLVSLGGCESVGVKVVLWDFRVNPLSLPSCPCSDEELQEMIDEADRDGDGEVSEEEFFRWVVGMGRRGRVSVPCLCVLQGHVASMEYHFFSILSNLNFKHDIS